MNSAIQIKLFRSADPDLYLLGGGGGGGVPDPEISREGGWGLVSKRLFLLRPFGPQFGLKIRRAPPLDPPLSSKAPILQEMNDDAGIFFLKKSNKRFHHK